MNRGDDCSGGRAEGVASELGELVSGERRTVVFGWPNSGEERTLGGSRSFGERRGLMMMINDDDNCCDVAFTTQYILYR